MNIPTNLFYTPEHEWFDPETGKFGITEFAQEQLGDVVFFDFSSAEGDSFEKGDALGTVESVKTVSDVYGPGDGVILLLNENIADRPEVVNEDPYGEGWMLQLKLNDFDKSSLLDAAAYTAMLEKI